MGKADQKIGRKDSKLEKEGTGERMGSEEGETGNPLPPMIGGKLFAQTFKADTLW